MIELTRRMEVNELAKDMLLMIKTLPNIVKVRLSSGDHQLLFCRDPSGRIRILYRGATFSEEQLERSKEGVWRILSGFGLSKAEVVEAAQEDQQGRGLCYSSMDIQDVYIADTEYALYLGCTPGEHAAIVSFRGTGGDFRIIYEGSQFSMKALEHFDSEEWRRLGLGIDKMLLVDLLWLRQYNAA